MVQKTDALTESESLAIALAPANFTEMKQAAEYLLGMLGVKVKIDEPPSAPTHFIEGRVAEIKVNDSTIGFLGEIHPKILHGWGIKMPAVLMEINLDNILNR